MDDDARAAYNAQLEVALQDEEDDYTGEPLSKWMPSLNPKMAKNEDPAENRAVFVVSAVPGYLGTCFLCAGLCWAGEAQVTVHHLLYVTFLGAADLLDRGYML
jgi:hypothetical protein